MRMKKPIFTDAVLALIPKLVAQNMRPTEIAEYIGCTFGSLQVRCSAYKISLRTPDWRERRKRRLAARKAPTITIPPKPVSSRQPSTLQSSLMVSRFAMSRLRQRAEATGMTEAELVTTLIEMIVQDDLYDAILDTEKDAA
jgi:hypothetical protein